MSARFTKTDWFDQGLVALAELGPEGLTIDALCARAGRTRGSFYHHFETMETYRTGLGDHWRQRHTENIIEKTEGRLKPSERWTALRALAMALDPATEQGMRRLAAVDANVREICRAVDARRIAYLSALYEQSGRFDRKTAAALARLEYAAFVGFQVIAPDAGDADLQDIWQRMSEIVGV
ncbi:MAG: TetR family transcriptional regulator [Hyphomicrobiales bacterium]|nr:TetR family transcriptional regulator [Hyphomicrobiales bacterium]